MKHQTGEVSSCTAFAGNRRIASGSYSQVALAARALLRLDPNSTVLIFDDDSGRQIDFNLHGTEQEVVARLSDDTSGAGHTEAGRGPGRPKLGVVGREVTLLPRHWDWLATQPGGASVALRNLVEQARRINKDKDRIRQAQERTYRFMSAVAGNLPAFEESARALFGNDHQRFRDLVAAWPDDVRDYLLTLAFRDGVTGDTSQTVSN